MTIVVTTLSTSLNKSGIVSAAMAYADRANDPESVAMVDNMLYIVESRVNRALLTMKSSSRIFVPITDMTQEYYDLPTGFSSFRSIKISTTNDSTAKRSTLDYVQPSKMDDVVTEGLSGNFYTIIANKIHIRSDAIALGSYIEYVNYADLTHLASDSVTNWLADSYPDCYIFGLTAELYAFAKDWESHQLWDQRFKDSLEEIDLQDDRLTWSGTPLTTQVG